MEAKRTQEQDQAIVGTVRRFGDFGPPYVVVAIQGDMAEIEFPETDERTTITLDAVLSDPLDS